MKVLTRLFYLIILVGILLVIVGSMWSLSNLKNKVIENTNNIKINRYILLKLVDNDSIFVNITKDFAVSDSIQYNYAKETNALVKEIIKNK